MVLPPPSAACRRLLTPVPLLPSLQMDEVFDTPDLLLKIISFLPSFEDR